MTASGAAVAVLTSACLAAACSSDTPPAPVQRAAQIAIDHCLDAIASDEAPDDARCPAFLVEEVRSAKQTCKGVEGVEARLLASDEPDIWTLDVNGDGRLEYLFAHEGTVACENAWSVFSCGSLGCPRTLYAHRSGAWAAIGAIYVAAMESIQVLDDAADDGYRDLRVTTTTAGEPEYWRYAWRGDRYEQTSLEVRGVDVELAASVHGLHPLVDDTSIRATPDAGAETISRYPAGTDVAIIGTTAGGGHYYVSPCNACESGFVPVSAVRAR